MSSTYMYYYVQIPNCQKMRHTYLHCRGISFAIHNLWEHFLYRVISRTYILYSTTGLEVKRSRDLFHNSFLWLNLYSPIHQEIQRFFLLLLILEKYKPKICAKSVRTTERIILQRCSSILQDVTAAEFVFQRVVELYIVSRSFQNYCPKRALQLHNTCTRPIFRTSFQLSEDWMEVGIVFESKEMLCRSLCLLCLSCF